MLSQVRPRGTKHQHKSIGAQLLQEICLWYVVNFKAGWLALIWYRHCSTLLKPYGIDRFCYVGLLLLQIIENKIRGTFRVPSVQMAIILLFLGAIIITYRMMKQKRMFSKTVNNVLTFFSFAVIF